MGHGGYGGDHGGGFGQSLSATVREIVSREGGGWRCEGGGGLAWWREQWQWVAGRQWHGQGRGGGGTKRVRKRNKLKLQLVNIVDRDAIFVPSIVQTAAVE